MTEGRRVLAFWADVVRSLYGRPLAWVALFVSSAFLNYAGGAVMFWFHVIFRGERGPAIDRVHHWLLDATLGFVALTPVLAVILPVAAWHAGAARSSHARVRLSVYVLGVAVLFTATTGPGPLLHNVVAGAGTPLADLATSVFGENAGMTDHAMHVHSRSPLTEGLLQVAVGLPVYTVCTWLSLHLVRLAIRATRGGESQVGAVAGEPA